MNKNIINNILDNRLFYLSIAVSFILIIPILLLPSFGSIDDWILLTFKDDSFFERCHKGYLELVNNMRFRPYFIIDQYLITRISMSAKFYYLVLFALAFAGLLTIYSIPKNIISKRNSYLFIPFIFLTMAFTDNFYRLAPNEKYLFILIPLFLIFYLKSFYTTKYNSIWTLLLIVNLSIYTKEIILVIFGSFSLCYLILNYNKYKKCVFKKNKALQLNIGIIISCIILLLSYYFFVVTKNTTKVSFGNFYSISLSDRILYSFEIYKGYIFKMPIATIFTPFALIVRIFLKKQIKIYFNQHNKDYLLSFYDSLLVSSWIYTIVVCLTAQGVYGRYLLPSLLFSFFPLIDYLSVFFKIISNKLFKITVLSLIIFSLLNSSIRGMEWALWFKLEEYSFKNTLVYLKSESRKDHFLNLYLADKNAEGNAEIFASYGLFMQEELKINKNNFDLFTIQQPIRDFKKDWWSHNINDDDYSRYDYSALQSIKFRRPIKGDVIIISAVNLRKDTVLNRIRNLNINLSKVQYCSQRFVYFPNPISLNVILRRKPLFRKYTLYNDIYKVEN